VRVLATGNIWDPRSNFKAFEVLAEKYSTLQFIWHGALREKQWGNLQFYTKQTPLIALMASADLLVWCADDDPCPLTVFEALYLGVRVMLFARSVDFGLRDLTSAVDGSGLLQTLPGAPQHAPLHAISKNSKLAEDVAQARAYALEAVGSAPPLLVQAITLRTRAAVEDHLGVRGHAADEELRAGLVQDAAAAAVLETPGRPLGALEGHAKSIDGAVAARSDDEADGALVGDGYAQSADANALQAFQRRARRGAARLQPAELAAEH
jgi:hypothetical protein